MMKQKSNTNSRAKSCQYEREQRNDSPRLQFSMPKTKQESNDKENNLGSDKKEARRKNSAW